MSRFPHARTHIVKRKWEKMRQALTGSATRGCFTLFLAVFAGFQTRLDAADVPTNASKPSPAPRKPNIVIILTDDLGYGDVSFLNSKSKIKTPHMDALAAAGVWATDAHAPSAVCSPTRYALLTGRYAWRGTLKRGVLMPWDAPAIETDRLTLPGMLKSQGYDTALVGKWHLGFNWPWKDGKKPTGRELGGKQIVDKFDWTKPITGGPITAGFNYYFGPDVPNFPPYAFIENEKLTCNPVYVQAKMLKSLGERGTIHGDGPGEEGWTFEKVMPAITDKTVNYICERAKNPKPYFLVFATTSPHTPVVPIEKFNGSSKVGSYGDFVVQTDNAVGKVIEALKTCGQFDNTLLIVTSDNGPDMPHRELIRTHDHSPAGDLRGMKWDLWEGGHRVPFIASWPEGGVKGGRRTDALISLTDLFATCASLLNVPLQAADAPDSLDVLPGLLQGKGVRSEMVYHSGNGKLGMRSGQWAYLEFGGKPEPDWYVELRGLKKDEVKEGVLYDLAADLSQTKNLSDQQPERVASMKARLETIRKAGRSRPVRCNNVDRSDARARRRGRAAGEKTDFAKVQPEVVKRTGG